MPPEREDWNSKDNMVESMNMPKENEKIDKPIVPVTEAQVIPAAEPAVGTQPAQRKVTPGRRLRDSAHRGGRAEGGAGRGPGGRGGRGGRSGPGRERVKPEFDSKIIDIRRVTRVTAGGRRMNFSVAVVAGDKKGRVGVGLGKGNDTAGAMEKATREAKKHMIKVPLSAAGTIPHAVEGKYGASRIKMFPARGRGIVAGSSARAVIELAGIKDVCAKYMSGSKNRLNNAKVAIEALKSLSSVSRDELRRVVKQEKPKAVK